MTPNENTNGTVNCGSVAASEPLIKRYGLGTKFYPNGISVLDMVERDDGDYVLHADFELLLRHNRYLEALLAKLKSSHCESNAKESEPVSDAAEIIDTLTCELPANHPIRASAQNRAKRRVQELYVLAESISKTEGEKS